MPTYRDLATEIAANVDATSNIALIGHFLGRRYQQLCSRARFRHLKRQGELYVPAAVTTGTVDATRGSTTITGDATALSAWAQVADGLIGRYVRLSTAWYEIGAVTATSLVLKTPFAEESVTAGGYRIVQRFHRLPAGVRWLGDFVHPRLRRPLRQVSAPVMDRHDPQRQSLTTDGPYCWIEAPSTEHSQKRIELYPYCELDELITFTYWPAPSLPNIRDDIPTAIDAHTLVNGALIDVYMRNASVAANAGNVEVAGYWRNEANTLKTRWEQDVLEAIRADKSSDDAHVVDDSYSSPGAFGGFDSALPLWLQRR